jgi:hypothetical protein
MLLLAFFQGQAQKKLATPVLVVGGGAGGTAAAIQAARQGVQVMLVEEGPWLGGMLTAAGVSATDGNDQLPSGIWAEFRERLYKVYGGRSGVATGWVSNCQFEPHVGDSILKAMAGGTKGLTVLYGFRPVALVKQGMAVHSVQFINAKGESLSITAKLVIDATELGDLLPMAKLPYDLGMEAGAVTGETAGVQESNDIVQDLTYTAILKDYGPGADCTIVKPQGYDPREFDGACTDYYTDSSLPKPSVSARQMLDYAKLPGGKYLLNWPNRGNDTYLNIVEASPAERARALIRAKATTLRFIYFIQHQLGCKQLGLADDEFPTADRLPLIPYYREGRRMRGELRLTMNQLAAPFTSGNPLYRTAIAVGDYPIDHHHKKNPAAPQHLWFYPIPSYSVPLGVMIPATEIGMLVIEKAISVSNVVNGTTRLQPVVMLTGQAAGVLAALSVQQQKSPAKISVREVQAALLASGAALLPYIDVPPSHPHFREIQQIGVTGILRGTGIPYQWANQTWFYPDSLVDQANFFEDYAAFDDLPPVLSNNSRMQVQDALAITLYTLGKYPWMAPGTLSGRVLMPQYQRWVEQQWTGWGLRNFTLSRPITREELAVLLAHTVNPFRLKGVDHQGNFLRPGQPVHKNVR